MPEVLEEVLNFVKAHLGSGWFCVLLLVLTAGYASYAYLRTKILEERLELAKERNDLEADKFEELSRALSRHGKPLQTTTSWVLTHATKRILIADDEQAICEVIGALIIEKVPNCSLFFAHDGERTLEYLRSESFSLLILDLIMPLKSGYEVLAEVNRKQPGLPVIVVTGYYLSQSHIAKTAGVPFKAFELLPKPFRSDQLISLVRKHLS